MRISKRLQKQSVTKKPGDISASKPFSFTASMDGLLRNQFSSQAPLFFDFFLFRPKIDFDEESGQTGKIMNFWQDVYPQ